MQFYLLENENPNAPVRSDGNRFWGYPSRRKPVDLVVMHVPVAIQDLVGQDETAEKVAAYFARTERKVSAHVAIDADSTVDLLPDTYTAFHVRGYNSRSVGIECGWDWNDWGRVPDRDLQVIRRVAEWVRPICDKYSIPPRRLTRQQVDAGFSGFVAHADLDPTRRKDPGPGFPWSALFSMINDEEDPTVFVLRSDPDTKMKKWKVEFWKRQFLRLDPSLPFGPGKGDDWGEFTDAFADAIRRFGAPASGAGIGPGEADRIMASVRQREASVDQSELAALVDQIDSQLKRVVTGLKSAVEEP